MSKETAMALAGQNPPVEQVPPVSSAEPPVDASRLAIFAKKEAAILKEREEVKRDREALKKEKEESDRYLNRGKQFDELFAKDKKAALRMLGLSDTDVINILADQEEPKEESVEDKARKIAQEEAQKIRDELAKAKEETEAAQNEAMITQLKSNLSSAIKANPEKYEYCAFEGAEAELQAYEIIVENLKESGELLTVEQALDVAESYYEARDKAMAALKKRQPVTPPAEEPAVEVKKAQAQSANKPTPTITNKMAPTTAAITAPKHETPAEKRERLIKKLAQGA